MFCHDCNAATEGNRDDGFTCPACGHEQQTGLPLKTITLTLDAEDHATITEELKLRRGRILPEGDSCYAGSALAECIREINEYRDIAASRKVPTPA